MTRLTQTPAIGAPSVLTEATTYVDLEVGVERSWGRQSEFDDPRPGSFSFTVDNADGRFTPGNPSSPLGSVITEGSPVCWGLSNGSQSRLVAGTIQGIEPSFPGGESAWSQVRITCEDALGSLARRDVDSISDSLWSAATGAFLWKLADASGSASAAEVSGYPGLGPIPGGSGPDVILGSTTSSLDVESSVLKLSNLSGVASGLSVNGLPAVLTYPATSIGAWSFWVQRDTLATSDFTITVVLGCLLSFRIAAQGAGVRLTAGSNTVTSSDFSSGLPYHVAVSSSTTPSGPNWTTGFTLWVNGVSVGSINHSATVLGADYTNAGRATNRVVVTSGTTVGTTTYLSRLAHSLTRIDESPVLDATAQYRIPAILATVPEVTLDTLPTLSSAIYSPQDSGSALDLLNDVIRAEQAAIYPVTTGTLVSSTQKLKVRARDRVAAVTYTFDAEDEVHGATDFVRDITNLISTVTVDGPVNSATYTDTSLIARAGSKNTSETLPLRDYIDLYTWGTDRVFRGSNVALRAASLTIDAFTTPTDRTADLMAMVPGDRIHVTGLPSTQLGFSTWDGWVLGVDETHNLTEHTFQIYLQPVLPRPIILDTDVLPAGGNLTLTSGCTNSATSISVTSSDGSLLSTTGGDYPLKFRLENECITVTAVSGASSPQTITATRGVTDPITGLATTAVSHSAAVVIEVADPAYLEF